MCSNLFLKGDHTEIPDLSEETISELKSKLSQIRSAKSQDHADKKDLNEQLVKESPTEPDPQAEGDLPFSWERSLNTAGNIVDAGADLVQLSYTDLLLLIAKNNMGSGDSKIAQASELVSDTADVLKLGYLISQGLMSVVATQMSGTNTAEKFVAQRCLYNYLHTLSILTLYI